MTSLSDGVEAKGRTDLSAQERAVLVLARMYSEWCGVADCATRDHWKATRCTAFETLDAPDDEVPPWDVLVELEAKAAAAAASRDAVFERLQHVAEGLPF